MGFSEAVKTCLGKYVTFSGRARRSEYWWFMLFAFGVMLIAGLIDAALFGTGNPPLDPPTRIFQPLAQLALLLPILAAGWRRMHDSGRPGWLLLLPLIAGLVTGLLFFGGVMSSMTFDASGMPTGVDGGMAFGIGMIGAAFSGFVQIILAIVMIWWLTRPTQPDANEYGPVPDGIAPPPSTSAQ
ncbi:DUF805 domain-containing protein [Pseudohalocynthiibacter aestuariivivens]|uniref:DUF805 domain-containing protein n=1 Tax=Roseovarius pelagicus TaxID=2980108 RepID=A0ABY6DET4_9RHOB|nr:MULTISPECIES: DUF805 domain-containing protein [Rhodobacterales]QIE46801.1 DUF805 domain-containing protein [Pseudohalocynthiibacter aestuariivivens]UXX84659.1 DUF805 domain-containing protein [Roseovarius pelagicus]